MMVTINTKKCYTPQEYLERELTAEIRSEYSQGVLTPMAGASPAHNGIYFSTAGTLWSQLVSTECRGFGQDMRVRVPECDRYYYPDIVVICGEPHYEDTKYGVLLNPKLIIEILSPSTEQKDRGEKFDCYETLKSLTDYLLISQTEPRIEHFSRSENGGWNFVAARGLNGVLNLPSIGCTLRLADIYARVAFPPPPVEESEK